MFAATRLHGKRLADLCHRLALSIDSGIDLRRIWKRETENARGSLASSLATVGQGVARGDTLTDSLTQTRGVFPRLFLEMVNIGEKTGSLAEVFHRLSDHYQRRHEMARALVVGLTWPLLQLLAALVIVGILIGVLGAVGARRLNGDPIDILGFGVTGSSGLLLYIQMIVLAGLTIAGLIFAFRRGWLLSRPVERLVMKTPSLGPCIEKICLARLTWVLHLTLNTELDLRQIVPLALRATGLNYYQQWTKAVTDLVAAGSPLSAAMGSTGIFPAHFLDALEVAEESGQLVDSMARLSQQYEEEAISAMKTLTVILGFAIGALVACLIIWMIIRLFQILYLDMINDAMNFA